MLSFERCLFFHMVGLLCGQKSVVTTRRYPGHVQTVTNSESSFWGNEILNAATKSHTYLRNSHLMRDIQHIFAISENVELRPRNVSENQPGNVARLVRCLLNLNGVFLPHINWVWWPTPVIPAQRKWRQDDQEFKVTLNYITLWPVSDTRQKKFALQIFKWLMGSGNMATLFQTVFLLLSFPLGLQVLLRQEQDSCLDENLSGPATLLILGDNVSRDHRPWVSLLHFT